MVSDFKEPFSWDTFIEDKIVDPFRRAKKLLDERGITFFILSPFQYRNRLMLKVWLLVVGLVLGVLPRMGQIAQQMNQEMRQSAFALIQNNKYGRGAMRISPLASSHENNVHVLSFGISGRTEDYIPSATDAFEVSVKSRGGSDSTLKVDYQIVPYSSSYRILLVKIDVSQKAVKSDYYYINVRTLIGDYLPTPIQVVLSSVQQPSPLYQNGQVSLSGLSTYINDTRTVIETAEKSLDNAIEQYELTHDRLLASSFTVSLSKNAMRDYVEKNKILKTVTDTSLTSDVINLSTTIPQLPAVSFTLSRDGVTVPTQNGTSAPTVLVNEYTTLKDAIEVVKTNLATLNTSRVTTVKSLKELGEILNRPIGTWKSIK